MISVFTMQMVSQVQKNQSISHNLWRLSDLLQTHSPILYLNNITKVMILTPHPSNHNPTPQIREQMSGPDLYALHSNF